MLKAMHNCCALPLPASPSTLPLSPLPYLGHEFLLPRPVRGQLWNMLSSSEPDGPDPDSEDAGADTAAAADAAAAAAAAHSHRRGDKGAGFSHILGEGGGAGPSSSPSTNIRALISLVHDPRHTPQVSAERAARARRPGRVHRHAGCPFLPPLPFVSPTHARAIASYAHSSECRINWSPFLSHLFTCSHTGRLSGKGALVTRPPPAQERMVADPRRRAAQDGSSARARAA